MQKSEKRLKPRHMGTHLSNEYQHDRLNMIFKKSLRHCVLDKRSFRVGRVNTSHFKLTFKEKCHLPSTTFTRTMLQIRFIIYLVNLNS